MKGEKKERRSQLAVGVEMGRLLELLRIKFDERRDV